MTFHFMENDVKNPRSRFRILVQQGDTQANQAALDPQLQVGPWFQTPEAAEAFIVEKKLTTIGNREYYQTVEIERVSGEPEWNEQPPEEGRPSPIWSVRRIIDTEVVLAISAAGLHVCDPHTHQERRRFVPSTPLPSGQVAAIGAQGQLVWLAGGTIRRLELLTRRSQVIARKVSSADKLHVSNCGRYVMLIRDLGFADGSLCVRSMESGSILWKSEKNTPVDSGRFSPSGRYVLRQWEQPAQSGSEVLFAGVLETQTGGSVFEANHTTYMESYHWGPTDETIVYGDWGSRPRRAYKIPSGERTQSTVQIGDIPHHPPPARSQFQYLKPQTS